jgi:hypothetical protein
LRFRVGFPTREKGKPVRANFAAFALE